MIFFPLACSVLPVLELTTLSLAVLPSEFSRIACHLSRFDRDFILVFLLQPGDFLALLRLEALVLVLALAREDLDIDDRSFDARRA